jgi:hypothetical protein
MQASAFKNTGPCSEMFSTAARLATVWPRAPSGQRFRGRTVGGRVERNLVLKNVLLKQDYRGT